MNIWPPTMANRWENKLSMYHKKFISKFSFKIYHEGGKVTIKTLNEKRSRHNPNVVGSYPNDKETFHKLMCSLPLKDLKIIRYFKDSSNYTQRNFRICMMCLCQACLNFML